MTSALRGDDRHGAGDRLDLPPGHLNPAGARRVAPRSASGRPRFLLRFGDARLVSVSDVAYALLDGAHRGVPVTAIADELTRLTGTTTSAADVRRHYTQLVERFSSMPGPEPDRRSLLVLPPAVVRRAGRALAPLFTPITAALVLPVALWLIWRAFDHGAEMAGGFGLVAACGLSALSVVVHELGHAAAATVNGARPGAITAALGPTGLTFCTDVTDAWRLPRSGRIAVNAGGVYLQTVVAAGCAAGYLASGWPVLATALVLTLMSIAFSSLPVGQTDSAWLIADLLGNGTPGVDTPFSSRQPVMAAIRWAGPVLVSLVTALSAWHFPDIVRTIVQVWAGNADPLAVAVVWVALSTPVPVSIFLVRASAHLYRASRRKGPSSARHVERESPDGPEPAGDPARAFVQRVDQVMAEFVSDRRELLASVAPDCSELVTRLTSFLLNGGKRIRPLFCYWGWRCAGMPDNEAIVHAGAAFELLHGGALIHDDIMDASDLRRGSPSAHRQFADVHIANRWHGGPAEFGAAVAILLGDLCLCWSDELLNRCAVPETHLARARDLFHLTRTELVGGQYLDLRAQSADQRTLDRALKIIEYKTAKYTAERPMQLGGVLGGASDDQLAAFSAFALPLGLAFQLRDDVLDAFGDPSLTGKPAGQDLREGKRTALVCLTSQRANASQLAMLDSRLGAPDITTEDVDRLREIIVDTGALAEVEALISRLALESAGAIAAASPDDADIRSALGTLAERMTVRTC